MSAYLHRFEDGQLWCARKYPIKEKKRFKKGLLGFGLGYGFGFVFG